MRFELIISYNRQVKSGDAHLRRQVQTPSMSPEHEDIIVDLVCRLWYCHARFADSHHRRKTGQDYIKVLVNKQDPHEYKF